MTSKLSAATALSSVTGLKPHTLVELLRSRALGQPDRLAYTFLSDGETDESSLTYYELDRQARAIASSLQEFEVKGERALLLYPPGLGFIAGFFGCLYAGVIAVPAYPPSPARFNRNLPRLQSIVADAQAKLVLTTSAVFSSAQPRFAQTPDLAALRWVPTDVAASETGEFWQPVEANDDSLAFFQYTSGSTGRPKGVMLSHGNLLHNASLVYNAMEHTTEDKYVSWLPTFHDMGFMAGVLQPLYAGIPVVLMSPASFLRSPVRWLQAISDHKATTSGGPNFAYDLCVRKIKAEERETIDLSSWTASFNGAEPVRAETIDRFAATFEQCGFRRETFYPCYGLAEATLIVSGGVKSRPPVIGTFEAKALKANIAKEAVSADEETLRLVGCGSSLGEQKCIIVNPESLEKCLPEEIGEIWISGDSVAKGYWNRPEETEHTFHAYTLDTREGPFLRTGDLGFIQNGELFITGRLKDLIIIRGLNHYPQDIELTVEQCHPALRPGCGAVFSLEAEGEERLVVVQELDDRQKPDVQTLITRIRQAIAEEHELQVYAVVLIEAGSIPKTSSGKIQRHACKAGLLKKRLAVLAEWQAALGADEPEVSTPLDLPQTEEEMRVWIATQVAAKIGLSPAEIDVNQSVISYGIDSLTTIELIHKIETELGIAVPLSTFLGETTITELATELLAQQSTPSQTTAPALEREQRETQTEYPLSSGQQALWFLHELAPQSTAYNIVGAVRIVSALDPAALRRAFQVLTDRHPSLRTNFGSSAHGPFQQVHDTQESYFAMEDASSWTEETLNQRLVEVAHQPFNLEHGALLRINLFKRGPEEHILLLSVHHIVADLWSLAVLMEELGVAYTAIKAGVQPNLPAPRAQYTDYVRWQTSMLASAEGERLFDYWKNHLAGSPPALNLTTDRPRPPVQTYRGASHAMKVDAELTERLKDIARTNGATLYMVLLAAFQVLLNRYTDQEEILVGSPMAGRTDAVWGGLVGYFVNPVVIKANFSGDPTFEEFLAQIRRNSVSAFEHQNYPFPLLVEKLQPERDLSRSPLFQVMFALQKAPLLNELGLASFALGEAGGRMQLGELVLETVALDQQVAQFDLSLMMAEVQGGLAASLKYNTDLYDETTIERLVQHFHSVLSTVAAQPELRLSQLPLLTADETELLSEWNDTAVDYQSRPQLLHQLFEQQAARTPAATALVFEETRLTYARVNERANQVAAYLQERGVSADTLVGVLMERSVEMVVALLGVLKAGGAYVPLDPEYPRERLSYMIDDAQIKVVLSTENVLGALENNRAEVICLDSDWPAISQASMDNPLDNVTEDNLAYAIYTSGSTGQPKGVMNSHRGICNRLHWMLDSFESDATDRVLQKTPFSFDVSVWEFFWPLITGATLVMARPGGHRDSAYLLDMVEKEQITTLHFVPSMLQVFLEEKNLAARCGSLKRVICSGEALPYDLQERFFEQLDVELYNLYGPTEAAVEVTSWKCEPHGRRRAVPIGRPIANTQMHILDKHLQAVPVGVTGDLYIGGVQVARGYLGRADLTAERFIPDPLNDKPGSRLYKTGDLARYWPDGEIEYVGRIDHQVKLRGFRIELGEIEATLADHPAVREQVVVVREDKRGEKFLVAYLTVHNSHQPTNNELRSFLAEKLPEYMVPSSFLFLDALPLTSSGKVDHFKLPAPQLTDSEFEADYTGPRNVVEEVVSDIWIDALGLERVSVHSNFFSLGGHSLLATRITSQIRELFQIDIPLRSFLEASSVAKLSETIVAHETNPGQTEKIARAFKSIRGMSEIEIANMLKQSRQGN